MTDRVVKCIGHLDPAQESVLQQITPKLQATFGRDGTWEDIVIAEMFVDENVTRNS